MYIEPLESRIAPAGLVTVALDKGNVTFTGSGADTSLLVQQVDAKTWALTGRNGTLVQVGAGAASALAFVSGVTGNVTLNFGAEPDAIDFDRVNLPKGLSASLGDGINFLTLKNTTIGTSFIYSGGSDVDLVNWQGDKLSAGGNLSIALGDGGGGFGLQAESGKIGGNLDFTGGSGDESFFIAGGAISVKGQLTAEMGAAGTSNIVINPRSLSVGGVMTIQDSDTGNVVNVNPRVSFSVGGKLTVDGRGGADTLNIGVGTSRVSLGALRVETALDADNDAVNIQPTGLLSVRGDLELFSFSGGIVNAISAEVIRIGRDLVVDSDSGGAAKVQSGISALSELTVGRDLRLPADADVASGSVYAPGTLKVGRLLGIGGTDLIFASVLAGQGSIGQDLVAGADGYASLNLDALSALTVKGRLIVSGSTAAELTADAGSLSVAKDLRVQSSGGPVNFDVDVEQGLSVGGNLAITQGSGAFEGVLDVGSARLGGLDISAIATTATLRMIGEIGRIQVLSAANFTLAASTSSNTELRNLAFGNIFGFGSGSGFDTLRIDDCTFAKDATFSTSAATDSIAIETRASITRGRTVFQGNVSIDLGEGNDTLNLAVPAGPFFNVRFEKNASFDGNLGTDSFGISPNVIFARAPGQPVVSGFE